MTLGVPESHQEHGIASTTLIDLGGYLDQGDEKAELESPRGPTTADLAPGDHDGSGDSLITADLQSDVPVFCQVGRCRYWHTDRKQVKRHRDLHFSGRFWWLCPNETGTCPSPMWHFRRKDSVIKHCRKHPRCGVELEAKERNVRRQGEWASENDLAPYDPTFHIPYRNFDGRTRRR